MRSDPKSVAFWDELRDYIANPPSFGRDPISRRLAAHKVANKARDLVDWLRLEVKLPVDADEVRRLALELARIAGNEQEIKRKLAAI
jgi:hypothetical protein